MTTVYLTDQQSEIRATHGRLIVHKDGAELAEIQLPDLESLHIFGRVEITTPAIQRLLKKEIEVCFYSYHGELLGQLTPPRPHNITLRLRQYDLCRDEEFRLPLAKEIVLGKITAAISILEQSDYNRDAIDLSPELELLRAKCANVEAATEVNSLFGIEGLAAASYWNAFARIVEGTGLSFDGRRRRPPPDEVNSLLSLGYVMLGSRIQSLLDGIGLDPYLGFFHAPQDRRPSLALDLIEPFRPDFVDRLTLRIFNLGILKKEHFQQDASGGFRLTRPGLKKYFAAFEKMLDTAASRSGESHTWLVWLRLSAEKFASKVRNA